MIAIYNGLHAHHLPLGGQLWLWALCRWSEHHPHLLLWSRVEAGTGDPFPHYFCSHYGQHPRGVKVRVSIFFPPSTLGGVILDSLSLSVKCHTRTMMRSTGLAPCLNCSTNTYQKQLMQSLLLINDLSWRFKKNSKTHLFGHYFNFEN